MAKMNDGRLCQQGPFVTQQGTRCCYSHVVILTVGERMQASCVP